MYALSQIRQFLKAQFTRSATIYERYLFLALTSACLVYFSIGATVGEIAGLQHRNSLILVVAWFCIIFYTSLALFIFLNLIRREAFVFGKLMVAHLLVAVVLVIDKLHYNMFLEHLNSDALQLMIAGVLSNEVRLEWRDVALGIGGIVGYVVACRVIMMVLSFMPRTKFALDGKNRLFSMVAGAFVIIFLAQPVYFLKKDWRAERIQAEIPWFKLINPNNKRVYYAVFDEYIEIDHALAEQQVQQLEQARKELQAGPVRAERTPNIIILHLESLRSDVLSEDNMPFLYDFARQRGTSLNQHFSTGNNTGSGIHGILHGLFAYYYQYVRAERHAPIPLDILDRLGYIQSVYYTKDMMYDNLYPLFFGPTEDHLYKFPEDQIEEDEQLMVESYLDELERDDFSQPRFDYLVFYSTHYNYVYPETFAHYLPAEPPSFTITSHPDRNKHMRGKRNALFNRYRNAALFADHLVSRIINQLDRLGHLDNTILVVTGDHGEEFWEHGRFGHTYGLVNEQIQVPAVLYFPEGIQTQYEITSHQDFFPTIFDYMKLDVNTDQFMTGKSLFRYDPDRDFAIASLGVMKDQQKFRHVMIEGEYKVEFEDKEMFTIRGVSDSSDQAVLSLDHEKIKHMLQKLRQARQWLPSAREKYALFSGEIPYLFLGP